MELTKLSDKLENQLPEDIKLVREFYFADKQRVGIEVKEKAKDQKAKGSQSS